jgi:hypothetical protein
MALATLTFLNNLVAATGDLIVERHLADFPLAHDQSQMVLTPTSDWF